MASPTSAQVSSTGITAPNFAAILAYLIAQYQSIFGADVYLGNDSQDGQLLGVIAQALTDANAAAIATYNSFSPATAQGAGLSSVVKINGLQRLIPTSSTVLLTLVGVVGTVIQNGQATDQNGVNVWNLSATVVIPPSGTIDVIATCASVGAITAAPATITKVQTPTYGWQTVNNVGAAATGSPIESDAALRVRQAVSVSLPSQGIFDGIVAALAALPGVTRVRGIENSTNTVDANGIPAHNLAFLIEGGSAAAIQNALFLKGPPGVATYGNVSQLMTSLNGSTRTVNFSFATAATINIAMTVKKLPGWSDAALPLIQAAMVAWIQSLPVGATVSYTNMIIPAYLTQAPYAGTYNITALTMQKNAGAIVTTDIVLGYNEASVAAPANIVITTI